MDYTSLIARCTATTLPLQFVDGFVDSADLRRVGLDLDAIAAVVIGGTILSGRVGLIAAH